MHLLILLLTHVTCPIELYVHDLNLYEYYGTTNLKTYI